MKFEQLRGIVEARECSYLGRYCHLQIKITDLLRLKKLLYWEKDDEMETFQLLRLLNTVTLKLRHLYNTLVTAGKLQISDGVIEEASF